MQTADSRQRFFRKNRFFFDKKSKFIPKIDKKNVSRIRKTTFYLQFCMETPEGHQKSIFNTPKMKKKTKIHMESIRQSLQA
jgi:hypothetical protein